MRFFFAKNRGDISNEEKLSERTSTPNQGDMPSPAKYNYYVNINMVHMSDIEYTAISELEMLFKNGAHKSTGNCHF